MDGEITESNGFDLNEFLIPDYILNPDLEPQECLITPKYPVIVFINSKSGGQLGGDLLRTYRSLLNKDQVIDLLDEAPDESLSKLYINLETLKQKGDDLAFEIEQNLRLIVAGGDGTAGWLLGVVCDLKLPRAPPIATVPLGTGNNLPFAFGWGKRNPGTDEQSVKSFLHKVKMAKEMQIDNWHIVMRMKYQNKGSCDPVASDLELPHALHSFQRVPSTDYSRMEDYQTFRGGFWNYFSMGMDAQVSYAFHAERKLHPEKFKNQLVNQSMYAKLGCTQGWFLGSLLHPAEKNIAQLAKVMIKKTEDSQWEELHVPRGIRSIVCLNLPSFSGGFNPWGQPRKSRFRRTGRDFTPSFVDDGRIEVVGFKNAWHGLTLLSPKGHGTRLAQASRIRFKFNRAAAQHTYMRIDGEPWKQPLPVDDDTVEVEISPLGQVNMLAVSGCRSKSTGDPLSVHGSGSSHGNGDDDDDDVDDDEEDSVSGSHGHAWNKFGAADTFKIPDGIDISHLS